MRKAISFILCFVFCFGIFATTAFAAARDTSAEEVMAADLKELGLFQGVSDTDFALDRAPSRTEALVMLIRVLGKEADALNGNWYHPFTDVAPWSDKYIGYAYQHDLTRGISATSFGTGSANAAMYVTFVLRALGYSDTNDEDFTWSDPFSLANDIGILPRRVDLRTFLRADVVTVSYAALPVCLKNTELTLAEKLIADEVFTEEQYTAVYDPAAPEDQPEQLQSVNTVADFYDLVEGMWLIDPEQTGGTVCIIRFYNGDLMLTGVYSGMVYSEYRITGVSQNSDGSIDLALVSTDDPSDRRSGHIRSDDGFGGWFALCIDGGRELSATFAGRTMAEAVPVLDPLVY